MMLQEITSLRPVEGCILRIRTSFPSLRPSEQKVAKFILDNTELVVELSVTEVARRSDVSDATVVKFSQRIGYTGFQEMKISLAKELPAHTRNIYGEIAPGDDLQTLKEKIFALNKTALEETCRILDQSKLEQAVLALTEARQVHICGVGASGTVAMDAEQKFMRIGIPCHAYIDPHIAAAMAALLRPGDVAIGISHSGATRDTVEALQTAQRAGATTICLTNFINSPVSRNADITLLTAVQETDFRSGAMASRVAQLSIVDVLFVAVAQARYELSLACLDKTRAAVARKRY